MMLKSSFGNLFRITTWGESHGKAVGVVVDGCPAGLSLSPRDVQLELDRRRPGQSVYTTQRGEADEVHILSGIFEGMTTGTPISMLVWNRDVDSSVYEPIRDLFRPGHADYTYTAKYGIRDWRGGGRASARETVGRVAAGAVAKKLLRRMGIEIVGYTRAIGGVEAEHVPAEIHLLRDAMEHSPLRCPDPEASRRMQALVEDVRERGDSIGGIAEVVAHGVPAGLGEPVFGKLDAALGGALLSIGAVKGVEIGAGFACAKMRGSEMNDPFVAKEGRIGTLTNNAGGILGGISTGEPIVCRIAVKPTPSIAQPQRTVSVDGEEREVSTQGRHDPTILPRIVPVAEAMVALVLVDYAMLAGYIPQRLDG